MATRLLELFCGQCDASILTYRKEGSGNLIRLYLDQVLAPREISARKLAWGEVKVPSLACSECGHLIGVPHGTKNRPAFRLIKGAFRRKEKK